MCVGRKKFLENACKDSARDRWIEEINKVRALDIEAVGLERNQRAHEDRRCMRKATGRYATEPAADLAAGLIDTRFGSLYPAEPGRETVPNADKGVFARATEA